MKVIRLLLFGVGFLLLGYLVGQLGLDAVIHDLNVIKWVFPLILMPSCAWHLVNTVAWSFSFPPDAFRPRLSVLFMAKLAGDAINQLTPLANLGGEPVKAYLIRRSTPGPRGMASVVVDKTAQLVVGLSFTIAGLGVLLLYQRMSRVFPVEYLVGCGLVLAVSALGVWGFYRCQGRLFTSLLTFLRTVGLKIDIIERNMGRAERIDTQIRYFYREHRSRFWKVLLCQGVGWLMGICETYVILRVLDAGVNFSVCFVLRSLGTVINSVFFFMPSSIGVMEGSQVFLFASLGLAPALGLSVGLIQRMRKIVWIFIGWLFLSHLSRDAVQHNPVPEAPEVSEASVVSPPV